ERVLDGRRLLVLYEHPHAGNAHDAPRFPNGADRFIRLAARMPRRERAAVGVRDEYRLLRDLERVERRAITAVRDVHRHADGVHPIDDRHSEVADPLITPFRGTVPNEVPRVL